MKILLCAPTDQGQLIPKGGIAVWARTVISYYRNHPDDSITLDVEPFDRKTMVKANMNPVVRIFNGITEYWGAYRTTRRRLRDEHFDVVHFVTIAQLGIFRDGLLLRMARHLGVKSVLHLHFGRIPEMAASDTWEWKMFRKVAGMATTVVAIDQRSYEVLQSKGFHARYLPNPLSEDIISTIQHECTAIPRIPGKLLYVGHIVHSKGIFELIEACKSISDIELHVVGESTPDGYETLRSAAGDDATWLKVRGVISHDDVIREMLSAAVFVLPTYTEGFPFVILESMACGCPIVTTDVGAIPEMLDIAHGMMSGICVKPRDVEALRAAIIRMLSDSPYAQACGDNARRRVGELYTMPKVWETLLDIWREC